MSIEMRRKKKVKPSLISQVELIERRKKEEININY